tara:strand:- start:1434 stop:2117 length:684 start_codon:yes stop_codon:yes gene_type:complete
MRILIQARMNSKRLPGKVLRKINNTEMLLWTINRLRRLNNFFKLAVITSKETSDDPIENFCKINSIDIYRGSLNNVAERFIDACMFFKANSFVRICADSPFIDPLIVSEAVEIYQNNNFDLVTNVQTRTFPKGQSVEVVKLSAMKKIINSNNLTNEHLEHPTKLFYEYPDLFSIKNFVCEKSGLEKIQLSIDFYEDYILANKIASSKELLYLSWYDILNLYTKNSYS